MSDYKDLIARISEESDLCRNETATDIADLLDEASAALSSLLTERDEANAMLERETAQHLEAEARSMAIVIGLKAERDGLRDNRFVLNRALAIAAADLESFGHHHAASAARAALRGGSDGKEGENG